MVREVQQAAHVTEGTDPSPKWKWISGKVSISAVWSWRKKKTWGQSTWENDDSITRRLLFLSFMRRGSVCVAHPGHVTGVAEEMRVQGEALRAGLVGEPLTALLGGREVRGQSPGRFRTKVRWRTEGWMFGKITHLTLVALEVIVFVHRHDPEDLLAALRHKVDTSGFVLTHVKEIKRVIVCRLDNTNSPLWVGSVVNRQHTSGQKSCKRTGEFIYSWVTSLRDAGRERDNLPAAEHLNA